MVVTGQIPWIEILIPFFPFHYIFYVSDGSSPLTENNVPATASTLQDIHEVVWEESCEPADWTRMETPSKTKPMMTELLDRVSGQVVFERAIYIVKIKLTAFTVRGSSSNDDDVAETGLSFIQGNKKCYYCENLLRNHFKRNSAQHKRYPALRHRAVMRFT
ncbi:fb008134-c702-4346-afbc-7e8b04639a57-CDS [Sclerotinia trifoliorum]|uniref:Fb008134-c702-4346-afbc-7e8b04639a57-CDS n=1 Tax=Sclerotinia trifoliorum TaxID=28548 RepID=A0A8H2VZ04_9HELO|nr:fb008134-c702-4346-afbc-7e8b04639a57-CDS [Sclerotinia trifoliorum]